MIKISNREIVWELIGEVKNFPKYTTQLINLANQNAQGTRPKVVGQMSELIKECPEKTFLGWKRWYLERYPQSVEQATQKINMMISNLKTAIGLIDEKMIRKWVEDLVFAETFSGLKFQPVILKKVAQMKKVSWRLSSVKEESAGIDGFLGEDPVSIKPITYKTMLSLQEEIKAKFIFYKKTKNGLEVDADEVLK